MRTRITGVLVCMALGLGGAVSQGFGGEGCRCIHSLRAGEDKQVLALFQDKASVDSVVYRQAHKKTPLGEGMEEGPKYIYVHYKDIPLSELLSQEDYESNLGSLESLGVSEVDEPEFVVQLNVYSLGAYEALLAWAHAQRNIEFFETDACDRTVTLIVNFENLAQVNDLVPNLQVRKGYVKYFPTDVSDASAPWFNQVANRKEFTETRREKERFSSDRRPSSQHRSLSASTRLKRWVKNL